MNQKTCFTLILVAATLMPVGCNPREAIATSQPNMPNPASVYCEGNGGRLEMRQDASGGTAGICVFPDGSECDEWAFFRGECKPGESLVEPAASKTPAAPANSGEGPGRQIVFYSDRGGGYNNVYLMEIEGPAPVQITHNEFNTFSGPFSPDGTHLLFTGFGLTHSYVGVMNPDGSGQTDLTNQPHSDEAFPAWSPDGSQIIFTSRRDGNNELYLMKADGSTPKRLTDSPKDDFAPAWSPDGSRIAFVSDRDNQTGFYSLYMMNPDGTELVRLTQDQSSDTAPDWSPDGMKIAYQSIRDGQADIYLIDTEGSGKTNLTQSPTDEYAPRWSPDGSQIAFQSNRDGNWEIYVMNADGSNAADLTNDPADDQAPYWVP